MIVIVSFATVLFGAFYMTAEGFICLASQLNGMEAPCPVSDPLGFASFHNSAISKISNLTLVNSATIGYLAMIALFVLFIQVAVGSGKKGLMPIPAFVFATELISKNSPIHSDRLNWFSNHENGPSLSWERLG